MPMIHSAPTAPRVQDQEGLDCILHAAMTDDSLELPTPPQVAAEVQRLTRADAQDDARVAANSTELARLIQRDVALAGQVMRVANSAMYARRTPVVTLPQAIAWLGMREIRTITFSAAVQSQVFASTHFREEMAALWRESVVTALFAQEIARLKGRDVESAYLCGLLHRAGLAVVLGRVGNAAARHRIQPDVARILPFAHRHEARVGALLAACWSLPPAVSAAITHWREPHDAADHRSEVMEVALATRMADESRPPGAGGELPDSLSGLASGWMDELGIHPQELAGLLARRPAILATADSFA